MNQRHHYHELTVMSGLAILFVLAIHGCGSALNNFYPNNATYAEAGMWLRAISNVVAPAVPMFLFVSGFKYAANDSATPYFVFLKKRLPRVLMSFAIINTVFWVLDSIKYMASFDIILLAKTYLHSWVGYSVAYQLWYIPMYCCVIIACPLVRRLIPSTTMRFLAYALIGIAQRVLETEFPLLETYPIRFISYPVFFEMGILAQERAWREKIANMPGVLGGGTYILAVMALSWTFPVLSANGLVKYFLYYFVGTAAMFALSVALQSNRILRWLGAVSYPVFLLHEPLIGRCVGALLGYSSLSNALIYMFLWVAITLAFTLLLIAVLHKIKCDSFVCNFSLS